MDAAVSQARELQGAERAADAYWQAHFFKRQPPGTLYGGQLVAWRRQETGAVPLPSPPPPRCSPFVPLPLSPAY